MYSLKIHSILNIGKIFISRMVLLPLITYTNKKIKRISNNKMFIPPKIDPAKMKSIG